jgi:hypothetical protein
LRAMVELAELTVDRGVGRELEVGVVAPTVKSQGKPGIYTNALYRSYHHAPLSLLFLGTTDTL